MTENIDDVFAQYAGAKSEHRLQEVLSPSAPSFAPTLSCMSVSQFASDTDRQGQVDIPVWVAHGSVRIETYCFAENRLCNSRSVVCCFWLSSY